MTTKQLAMTYLFVFAVLNLIAATFLIVDANNKSDTNMNEQIIGVMLGAFGVGSLSNALYLFYTHKENSER